MYFNRFAFRSHVALDEPNYKEIEFAKLIIDLIRQKATSKIDFEEEVTLSV